MVSIEARLLPGRLRGLFGNSLLWIFVLSAPVALLCASHFGHIIAVVLAFTIIAAPLSFLILIFPTLYWTAAFALSLRALGRALGLVQGRGIILMLCSAFLLLVLYPCLLNSLADKRVTELRQLETEMPAFPAGTDRFAMIYAADAIPA